MLGSAKVFGVDYVILQCLSEFVAVSDGYSNVPNLENKL